jgi:hypothetical protein
MKRLILLGILVAIATGGFSQDFDDRLLVKYSKQDLVDMKANDPELYNFTYACLNHGFYLANFSGKSLPKEVIGEIEVADISNINFFALKLEPVENRYLYYKIIGQDKLLVVRSIGHIKMEAAKGK